MDRLRRIKNAFLTIFRGKITTTSAPPLPIGHLFEKKILDLDMLAREAGTPLERLFYTHRGRPMFKWAHYIPVYDKFLSPFIGKEITLVEIGLAGGGSIELWRKYLGPQIRVIGIDKEPGCEIFRENGVEILIGDQGDAAFLQDVARTISRAHIIIDDGSHVCSHQIQTFETLFPLIEQGGVYICEDIHTSYWAEYGGGLGRADTFISYVKDLIDKLHFKYGVAALAEDDVARHVGAITVVDSLVAFEKAAPRDVFIAWVGEGHN